MLADRISRLAKLWASRKALVENRFPFSLRADSVVSIRVGVCLHRGGRIVGLSTPFRVFAMPVPTSIDYGQVASGYDNSRRVEPGSRRLWLKVYARWALFPCLKWRRHWQLHAALTASGLSVTALDRSPAMVEIGAQKTLARWILSDASAIALRTRSVDAIVGVNVLHHLPALPVALAEFRRVARAGAALQAVVRENLETLWYRHYFPEIDDALLPLHPTLGDLIASMFQAGFRASRRRRSFTRDDAISLLRRRAHGLISCSIRVFALRPPAFDGLIVR